LARAKLAKAMRAAAWGEEASAETRSSSRRCMSGR
jgi:hypothetical protein